MSKELLNKAINIYVKFHGLDLTNVEHKIFARDRIRYLFGIEKRSGRTKVMRPHVLATKAVF